MRITSAPRIALFGIALIAVLVPPTRVDAGPCRITGSVCVDGPGTRNVNGLDVYRDCWQFADTYECVDPAAIDYCAPIAANVGCAQLTSTCSQTAFDGTCLTDTKTWQCADPLVPEPPQVTRLADTFTIVKDVIDDSACRLLASTATCTQTAARTCTEGAGIRNINGLDIYKDCWQWTETYACSDATGTVSNCGTFETNPACSVVSQTCTDTNPITNTCSMTTRVYRCTDRPSTTTSVTQCGQLTCIEGICDNADDPPDTGLAKAVTALELSRQSSAYADYKTRTIFNGVDNRCSRKLFGTISCCGSQVKANTASSLLRVNNVYGALVPESIPLVGSAYTHDPLYQNDLVPPALMNQLYGEGAQAYANLDVFGITWTTSAGFAFDPVGFLVAVAANMTADLLSCTKDEQLLSLKKGDNLCHYVGTYCDSRAPLGGCVTKKDTYCCFNSVLARIINEQGRPQVGRDWGTAQSPQCQGFSFTDLAKLDFSVMDFSEFEVLIESRQLNTAAIQQRASDQVTAIQNAPPGSYFSGPGATGQCTPPNCPP